MRERERERNVKINVEKFPHLTKVNINANCSALLGTLDEKEWTRKSPWHEKESVLKTGTITRCKGKQDEYVERFLNPCQIENSAAAYILIARGL